MRTVPFALITTVGGADYFSQPSILCDDAYGLYAG